jgi:hypothetical protein
MTTKPATVLGTIESKYVGYYHNRNERQYVGVVVVDNLTDFVVTFSLTLFRRGKRKGAEIYDRYRFAPHSTLHYYPDANSNSPFFLHKGDKLKARSSKKGALAIKVMGLQL